ncbi:MAG TPA: hypothetical protein VEH84_13360 [Alphaproteobacteria bacterium]|nr:hypothetical protein [Alphaproteobacteria bacterium]
MSMVERLKETLKRELAQRDTDDIAQQVERYKQLEARGVVRRQTYNIVRPLEASKRAAELRA